MEPRPKKSLGQHFLRDRRTAERIVDLLQILPQDQVLEIGPGPGALTGLLLQRHPSRLVLIEKDDYWADMHAQSMAHIESGSSCIVEVRHADALQCRWEDLHGGWKLIGNLPYNVASPLIWDLVSRVSGLSRAVFMIQKEVADRMAAKPGSRTYGALSAWVQSYVEVHREFIVRPEAFAPPPKVDSAVVSFMPLPASAQPRRPVALARVLKMCFQQRRKQLQAILRRNGTACPENVLEPLHIAGNVRPESLSPQQFQELSHILEIRSVDFPEKT